MSRLSELRKRMRQSNVDEILISNPENRRYLSGFTGSAGALLISSQDALIITDFRYWEQVGQEVEREFTLFKQGPDLWQSICELIGKLGWEKTGFEASLCYRDYETLTQALPKVRFQPLREFVETQRWVKDDAEIAQLAKAEEITAAAFAKIVEILKPGVTERDVTLEFDYQLRRNGAEGNAFETIVVSGWRSALPHGAPSDKQLAAGDLITIDGGALYHGYHGDMTRTFVMGKASSEQKEIYRIVLEAQEKALQYLRAGIPGNVVDRVARQIIMEYGHGDHFGHGLGHSVGLNIHENPRLSTTEENKIPVDAVITVEPGIYVPNWGGVRIEDLVVVKEDGVINLTHAPKEFLLEV